MTYGFKFNPFSGNFDLVATQVDLATTDVTGILPVSHGGTGASSLTAHDVIVGNGTSAVSLVAPGASGTVLTSNGATLDPSFQALFSPVPGAILNVDNTRVDSYTADGTSAKPFKTIADALNQVIANNDSKFYTIYVASGDYTTEDITLNSTVFSRIAIVASSVANGQLFGSPIPVTTIRDIISTSNNDNLKALLISGFTFRNLSMIGATTGTNFCNFGAMISNCTQLSTATVSIDVENAGRVIFADCGFSQSSGSGDVTVQNVISFSMYKCLTSIGTMTIISNGALNKPSGFSNTGTQFSFGSLAGAVSLGVGATLATRWNRVLATTSISGTMSSIMANFIGAVTVNSGGVWNSTGDLVNNTPTNAGTITQLGKLQASGANLSSLSASQLVKTDANKYLVSGTASLTTDVSGILPIANGGTGNTSGTATVNANMTGDVTSVGNATTYAGTVPLNKGGTGQTTKAAAFDALSPMSATGDIIVGGASGTGTRLAIGSTNDVLTVSGGTPVWAPASGSSFGQQEVRLLTTNGRGGTNTEVVRWTTVQADVGADLTLTQSSSNGDSITVATSGVYAIYFQVKDGSADIAYISNNSTTFVSFTDVTTLSAREVNSGFTQCQAVTCYLFANDVVRFGVTGSGTLSNGQARMVRCA